MTFKDEILSIADGEPIEKIVIGRFGWSGGDGSDEEAYGFGEDEGKSRKPIPWALKETPIDWNQVESYLDYNYSSGYGSPDCHAIYAYTANKIIFVSTYDGSTSVEWIPRNPVDCLPEMFGE